MSSLPLRENFICANCIKGLVFEKREGPEVECRLMPDCRHKTPKDWCAQGEWHFRGDRGETNRYYFGEWDGVDDVPDAEIQRS